VENLRYYLESEEIRTAANGGVFLPDGNESNKQTPLLLGRRFAYQGDMNDIFDSGTVIVNFFIECNIVFTWASCLYWIF
jgi:hypothetical protein